MEEVRRLDTVRQYNDYVGVDTPHPLVSMVNFNEVPTIIHYQHYMGVYAVFLKISNVVILPTVARPMITKMAQWYLSSPDRSME